MSSILASLRSLLPDDALRGHMAARTAHHVPATGAIDPASILTVDTIEQALARGAVPVADLRVFGAQTRLDLPHMGVVKDDALRPLALQKLARQGTLVITNAQRISPELWDLACGVERWLGATVSLTAVASFAQSGLKLHYDSQDVIAVHLGGSKTWSLFGPPIADSAQRPASPDEGLPTEITQEVELRPGDLLYVPSGLFHRCTPGDWSLHLSIVITWPTGADFARDLTKSLMRAANASTPLPGFLGGEALASAAEAIKARMIAHIEATDAMEWYATHRARQARAQSIDFGPAEMPPQGVAMLNVTTAPHATLKGKLQAGDAAVAWSPVLQALTDMLREGPQPIAALPELLGGTHSPEAVNAALARLAEAGLIRVEV